MARWLGAALIAAALVSGRPDAAQAERLLPGARKLLVQAQRAAGHVPFSARQIMAVRHRRRVTATITQEYHAGDGRLHVETLSPQAARGRGLVDDGRYRWQYEPARKLLYRHPS